MAMNIHKKMNPAVATGSAGHLSGRLFKPFVVRGDHETHAPRPSGSLDQPAYHPRDFVFAISQGKPRDSVAIGWSQASVHSHPDHRGIRQKERMRAVRATVAPGADPGLRNARD